MRDEVSSFAKVLSLTTVEIEEINAILDPLREAYSSAEEPEFLFEAPVLARDLPTRIHQHLNQFRRGEPGYAIIVGHPVDDVRVGPTPSHWNQSVPSATLTQDLLLVLYGALLGDVFGWATQQDGRIVHDVLPIRENEGEQLGTAADVLLSWHSEDAFHPLRPDWIALACIRNPSGAPTTVAVADDLRLSDEDIRVLFEPRFQIRPDSSHLPTHNSAASTDFGAIEALLHAPPSIPLMWGDPRQPYMRADESLWDVADDTDSEARAVLERFAREIDLRLRDVVLRPGDFCFLDNYKVVHGRKPFRARYDGTDRWLKRVCITRDLRKSRAERRNLLSHVLG